MPLVGKDWTQSGVARLFSAIKVVLAISYKKKFCFPTYNVFKNESHPKGS